MDVFGWHRRINAPARRQAIILKRQHNRLDRVDITIVGAGEGEGDRVCSRRNGQDMIGITRTRDGSSAIGCRHRNGVITGCAITQAGKTAAQIHNHLGLLGEGLGNIDNNRRRRGAGGSLVDARAGTRIEGQHIVIGGNGEDMGGYIKGIARSSRIRTRKRNLRRLVNLGIGVGNSIKRQSLFKLTGSKRHIHGTHHAAIGKREIRRVGSRDCRRQREANRVGRQERVRLDDQFDILAFRNHIRIARLKADRSVFVILDGHRVDHLRRVNAPAIRQGKDAVIKGEGDPLERVAVGIIPTGEREGDLSRLGRNGQDIVIVTRAGNSSRRGIRRRNRNGDIAAGRTAATQHSHTLLPGKRLEDIQDNIPRVAAPHLVNVGSRILKEQCIVIGRKRQDMGEGHNVIARSNRIRTGKRNRDRLVALGVVVIAGINHQRLGRVRGGETQSRRQFLRAGIVKVEIRRMVSRKRRRQREIRTRRQSRTGNNIQGKIAAFTGKDPGTILGKTDRLVVIFHRQPVGRRSPDSPSIRQAVIDVGGKGKDEDLVTLGMDIVVGKTNAQIHTPCPCGYHQTTGIGNLAGSFRPRLNLARDRDNHPAQGIGSNDLYRNPMRDALPLGRRRGGIHKGDGIIAARNRHLMHQASGVITGAIGKRQGDIHNLVGLGDGIRKDIERQLLPLVTGRKGHRRGEIGSVACRSLIEGDIILQCRRQRRRQGKARSGHRRIGNDIQRVGVALSDTAPSHSKADRAIVIDEGDIIASVISRPPQPPAIGKRGRRGNAKRDGLVAAGTGIIDAGEGNRAAGLARRDNQSAGAVSKVRIQLRTLRANHQGDIFRRRLFNRDKHIRRAAILEETVIRSGGVKFYDIAIGDNRRIKGGLPDGIARCARASRKGEFHRLVSLGDGIVKSINRQALVPCAGAEGYRPGEQGVRRMEGKFRRTFRGYRHRQCETCRSRWRRRIGNNPQRKAVALPEPAACSGKADGVIIINQGQTMGRSS